MQLTDCTLKSKFLLAVCLQLHNAWPWITYYYSLLKNEMRLSEWGLLSTGFVAGPLMSDLDGIICLDPKPGENEKSHASMAEPKMIPSFELTCIVLQGMRVLELKLSSGLSLIMSSFKN